MAKLQANFSCLERNFPFRNLRSALPKLSVANPISKTLIFFMMLNLFFKNLTNFQDLDYSKHQSPKSKQVHFIIKRKFSICDFPKFKVFYKWVNFSTMAMRLSVVCFKSCWLILKGFCQEFWEIKVSLIQEFKNWKFKLSCVTW